MLFNSLEFLIFFPVVFILYWFVFQKNYKQQNVLLLVSSYIFYGWWDWRFLSLIIISSTVDFTLGQLIHQSNNQSTRKKLLWASILINLGILGFFKYFNFFIDSFIQLLAQLHINTDVTTLNIILPIGISFYTFQTLSYTIDIYKKKLKSTEDIISFFTFVSFFPQLVAGPIERAKHLIPQFTNARTFDYQRARSGGQLILLGFFKKIVVADSLAILVNTVYDDPQSYAGFPMLVATIFFAFQIYCDFSGYSNIAIGLSRILGFDLMKNFKTPYFSKSLTEFWRRWHISLSSWFRDYLYIPLGGSRTGKLRVFTNIFITFVISGLWHGANWTFVIWGAIHGLFLILEKLILNIKDRKLNIVSQSFSMLYTFSIVCFAWIFFRSNHLNDAIFIIRNMFSDISDWGNFMTMSLKFRGMGITETDLNISVLFLLLLIAIDISLHVSKIRNLINKNLIIRWSLYLIMITTIIITASNNNAENFIYFQF